MAAKSCPEKIPILVEIEITDVNDQIAAGFDQIKVERSTTVIGGPFAEISTAITSSPQARINLVQNRTEYTFEDPDGSTEYFYRFVIFDSTNSIDGFTSAAAPGAVDPALEICSVEELKTFYLFGVDLTNDRGEPYPDSLFAHYIKSAVDWLEHRLMIRIRPLTIDEERQDYYRPDYDKYIWIELNNFPVIEVSEVKLVLPGEQVVQVFEREWIHIQRESGQLQLVPGTGTAGSILLGASGAWLPLIYGNNKFIPDVFRVKYKAGFGKPSPGALDVTPGAFPGSPVSNSDPTLEQVPRWGWGGVWWNVNPTLLKRYWDRFGEIHEEHHGVALGRGEKRMLVLCTRVEDTYEKAVEAGVGRQVPTEWFLQDIRD